MSEQIEVHVSAANGQTADANASAVNEPSTAFQVVNEGFSTREAIEEAKRDRKSVV